MTELERLAHIAAARWSEYTCDTEPHLFVRYERLADSLNDLLRYCETHEEEYIDAAADRRAEPADAL